MRKIIILQGTYGYKPPGARRVTPVSNKDGPVGVTDTEAARLVKMGIAIFAAEDVVTTPKGEGRTRVNPRVEENYQEKASESVSGLFYNADMKAADLRAAMEQLDIPYKFGMSKVEMADALNTYTAAEYAGSEDDGETPPLLSADAPVS